MDFNAHINWVPGLPLNAQLFRSFDQSLDDRALLALKAAVGRRFGLLPNAPFSASCSFVQGSLEISHFRCTALLPSGRFVCADQPVSLKMPKLSNGSFFLVVTIGSDLESFEKDDVPFLRPVYSFDVLSFADMMLGDYLPVAKFVVADGTCSFVPDYRPPALSLAGQSDILDLRSQIADAILNLANHHNLDDADARCSLLRYNFRIRRFNDDNTIDDLSLLLEETVQAVEFFILAPHVDTPETIVSCNPYDFLQWLRWILDYLNRASLVLDDVVLVDNSIDYDKLKEQIKEELYQKIIPELHLQISQDLRNELNVDIDSKLSSALSDYLDGTFRQLLHDQLNAELDASLQQSLFTSLYQSLYDALYVKPVEDTNVFTPLI